MIATRSLVIQILDFLRRLSQHPLCLLTLRLRCFEPNNALAQCNQLLPRLHIQQSPVVFDALFQAIPYQVTIELQSVQYWRSADVGCLDAKFAAIVDNRAGLRLATAGGVLIIHTCSTLN